MANESRALRDRRRPTLLLRQHFLQEPRYPNHQSVAAGPGRDLNADRESVAIPPRWNGTDREPRDVLGRRVPHDDITERRLTELVNPSIGASDRGRASRGDRCEQCVHVLEHQREFPPYVRCPVAGR